MEGVSVHFEVMIDFSPPFDASLNAGCRGVNREIEIEASYGTKSPIVRVQFLPKWNIAV